MWTARLLKLLIVLFLAVCTLLLLILAFILLVAKGLNFTGIVPRLALGGFFGGLAAVLGWYTWRFYTQPVATKRPATVVHPSHLWFAELQKAYPSAASREVVARINVQIFGGEFARALSECERLLASSPDDTILLTFQAVIFARLKEYARAEGAWTRVLSQIPSHELALYSEAYVQKLSAMMRPNNFSRFKAEIDRFLALPLPASAKIFRLDQLACTPLYLEIPESFEFGEFCARKGLDLAPDAPSVQGTLGAFLVERGAFDEAEPMLRFCHDRGVALHDRGISGVYLALIAEHRGDSKTAEKLTRQSIILYAEPWLKHKAEALLTRLAGTLKSESL